MPRTTNRRVPLDLRMAAGLFVFLTGTPLVASALTPSPPSADSASSVWFCQIGRWDLLADSATGERFLYHDARLNAAFAGPSTSNVKLNQDLRSIRLVEATFSTDSTDLVFGLLLRSPNTLYHYLLTVDRQAAGLVVRKQTKVSWDTLDAFLLPDRPGIGERVSLKLVAEEPKMVITCCGHQSSVLLPPEHAALSTIGLVCLRGNARVWKVSVDAQNYILRESFGRAMLMNLKMQKMFGREGKRR